MSSESNVIALKSEPQMPAQAPSRLYRFDLFRGVKDRNGRVMKQRSVGVVLYRDGMSTHTVYLKTFLKDTFYLLSNTRKSASPADFVILTREEARNVDRKYFWNNVGEANVMSGINEGLLELSFDLLGTLYMNLSPNGANNNDCTEEVAAAA